jgi:ABC-type dipeptide/oligopeptide/nickel transport system permease component
LPTVSAGCFFLPVTLFGMSVIIFLFIQFLGPETRASFYIKQAPRNPAVLEGIIKRYGFRDPIPIQYWNWIFGKADPDTRLIEGGLLRGNLGFSRFGGCRLSISSNRVFRQRSNYPCFPW